MNRLRQLTLLLALFLLVATHAMAQGPYLFVYFTGNDPDDESIHYALSPDGYNFRALNGNRPVLSSGEIASTGCVRDPHILRGRDGWFRMVATDMKCQLGWDSNRAMVLLRSRDLIHWQHHVVHIPQRFAGQDDLLRVWAPQTIYDRAARKYMVYWSMKHGDGPDIIYYAYATDDFSDLATEPRVLFQPQSRLSCIDGDIVFHNGLYHLFYKTEGHGNGIKVATSPTLTGGVWTEEPDYKQLTTDAVEGAGVFPVAPGRFILMYDVYMRGRYEFAETSDLSRFTPCTQPVTMDFHPRHGTVIPITRREAKRLQRAFP